MKTLTKGAGALLIMAGLLLYVGGKWSGDASYQIGVQRDRHAGPERTFDDREKHTIEVIVRYRPARELTITWMIATDGEIENRWARDRPEWEETRTKIPEGVVVGLYVDNEREGGYVNCEIRMDGVIKRHHTEENSPPHREVCALTYVVGDR